MFLTILGVLPVSFVLPAFIDIAAKLTLGE
jgi:hypothetical protein